MATLRPNRDRARTVALSVLVLCCAGFLGGMIYLRNKAEAPPIVGMPHAPDPQLVAETEGRKKEKIMEFRDKWQVWAKAHQPQLRAMLRAQPDDMAALAGVADAIPSSPTKENCGITGDDLGGIVNGSDPVVTMISWNHGLMNATSTPELAAQLEKAKEHTRSSDRSGFKEIRDVMVSSTSSAWSKKNYCLWASGRVTVSEYPMPGIEQKVLTVAPSYDFLVSPKQNA